MTLEEKSNTTHTTTRHTNMNKHKFLTLFLVLIPITTFPYKITNSPASTKTIVIQIYKPKEKERKRVALRRGKSTVWLREEIRKQWKVDHLFAFAIVPQPRSKKWLSLHVGSIPLNANLEILIGDVEKDRLGIGAIDWSTGKIYNGSDLEKMTRLIKKNHPAKLQYISRILKRIKEVSNKK